MPIELDIATDFANRLLQLAAAEGFDNLAKFALDKGGHSSSRGPHGLTPLHLAVTNQHLSIVRLLLSRKVDVNCHTETTEQETALHLAASVGNGEIARLLLDHGAEVNSRDHDDKTPLHLAARSNDVDMITILLNHGASHREKCRDLLTPLHEAAIYGAVESVRLLLARGASPRLLCMKSLTPGDYATEEGHQNITKIIRDGSSRSVGLFKKYANLEKVDVHPSR